MPNEINMPQDVLDKLNFLDEIQKERKDKEAVAKIEAEYLADEKKKMIWESGFGEKLKNNASKVNDTDWINGQLEIAVDRIKLQHEMNTLKNQAEEKKEEPKETAPMQPQGQPVEPTTNEEFNYASQDIFKDKDRRKKLSKENQIFLDINEPKSNPNWF